MKIPRTIFVTNKTNIRYFAHFDGTAGSLILHLNRGNHVERGVLLSDSRYTLLAKVVLPKHISYLEVGSEISAVVARYLKKKRITELGFEGNDISWKALARLKKNLKSVRCIDVNDFLNEMRMKKNPQEVAFLRKAQAITDKIFSELKKAIRIGQRETDIAWMIEMLARKFGADDISFPPIVAFAENSACPHHHPTTRTLRRGNMILIDMGVMYKGYCSDMTRMLFTKKPTQEQRNVYKTVLHAQEKAIKKLRAGMRGETADTLARDVISKAGFGKQFGHSLGHGVGLDIHELPNLSPQYKKKIPERSVVTVEPGIYLPGEFGVRLEDMVIVREKNAENITASSKKIEDSIIQAR